MSKTQRSFGEIVYTQGARQKIAYLVSKVSAETKVNPDLIYSSRRLTDDRRRARSLVMVIAHTQGIVRDGELQDILDCFQKDIRDSFTRLNDMDFLNKAVKISGQRMALPDPQENKDIEQ